MAGRGSRFANAGYDLPKPLINIHGVPMISYVIKNVTPKCEHHFIFICLEEHVYTYHIDQVLKSLVSDCSIVITNQVTQGAACTVLLAEEYINSKEPLMIANSDQYVMVDINDYLEKINNFHADGLIMTMTAKDNKWSFVRLKEDGSIAEVQEKEVISNEATVGIYNYRYGSDFVSYAREMIALNDRVKEEFYVAPVYNYMIQDGKKVTYYNIGSIEQGMYGLGIPEDLEYFKTLPVSKCIFYT